MKKRTALTILAFVLLIAAIAVPSVLLTQEATAETATDKYGDFVLVNDYYGFNSKDPYYGKYVITSSAGWDQFLRHISGMEVDYSKDSTEKIKPDLFGNGDEPYNGSRSSNEYYLLADITLNRPFKEPEEGPIGPSSRNFKGKFYGGMHTMTIPSETISLERSSSDSNYCGALFNYLAGEVRDLYIEVGEVKLGIASNLYDVGQNFGIICGNLEGNGVIERVAIVQKDGNSSLTFEDYATNAALDMGVVCGYASSSYATIAEVYTNLTLTVIRNSNQGNQRYIGGLVGSTVSNGPTIKHCLAENYVYASVGFLSNYSSPTYVGGLVGNTRNNPKISYCVANNRNVGLSVRQSGFSLQNGLKGMAAATIGGGNLYSNGIYASANALNKTMYQEVAYLLNNVRTKVFSFTSPTYYTQNLPSYTLNDITTAAGLINSSSGTDKWTVKDGKLMLSWMVVDQPVASYDKSTGKITITRDPLYYWRNLYYNVSMTLQGAVATPKTVDVKSSGAKTITGAKMYWDDESKSGTAGFIESEKERYTEVPSTEAAAAGVTAGKNVYLVLELSGINLTDDIIGSTYTKIDWKVTNQRTNLSQTFAGGVLNWEALQTAKFEFVSDDILKVEADYGPSAEDNSTAGTGTVTGFLRVNDAPSGNPVLKQERTLPSYLVPGQEFTLDMYEAPMYGGGAAGEVTYEIVGSSATGTKFDRATGKLTLGADEAGVDPGNVLKLKAVCEGDDNKFTEFTIPVKRVPTVNISGGDYGELWYDMNADPEKNTLTAAPASSEESFVTPVSYAWTVTLNGETISPTPAQSADKGNAVLVVPESKNTVAKAGKLVFSVVMNYALADGTPKSTAPVTKEYPVKPTITLGVENPITQAGTYECISELTGGATGTVIYSIAPPSNPGVSISTVNGKGRLVVGADPTDGAYHVTATWSNVKDEKGETIIPKGGYSLQSNPIHIGVAAITSVPDKTEFQVQGTAEATVLTVACDNDVLKAGAQWSWAITEAPSGHNVALSGISGNICTVTVRAGGKCGKYTVTATAPRSDDNGVVTATYSFEVVPGGNIAFEDNTTFLAKGKVGDPNEYSVTIPDADYLGGTTGNWEWGIDVSGVSFRPNIDWHSATGTSPTVYVRSTALVGSTGTLTGTYAYTVGGVPKQQVYTVDFTITEVTATDTDFIAWRGMDGLITNLLDGLKEFEIGTLLDSPELEPVVVASAEEHSDRCLGTVDKDSCVQVVYLPYTDPHDEKSDVKESRVGYIMLTTTKPDETSLNKVTADGAEKLPNEGYLEPNKVYIDEIGPEEFDDDEIGKYYCGADVKLNLGAAEAYYVVAWASTELKLKDDVVGEVDQSERLMADSSKMAWEIKPNAGDHGTLTVVGAGPKDDVKSVSLDTTVESNSYLTSDKNGNKGIKTVNGSNKYPWETWESTSISVTDDKTLKIPLNGDNGLIAQVFGNQYKDRRVAGKITVTAWMDETAVYTSETAMTERPSSPIFTPGKDDTIDYEGGVTLSCLDSNTDIYYIIHYNTTYEALGKPKLTPETEGVLLYKPGETKIPFPMDKNRMTIIAVSKNEDGLLSYTSYVEYANKNRQPLPSVTATVREGLGEIESFSPTVEYNVKDGFEVYFDNAAFYYTGTQFTGKIYYTTDGRDPSYLTYDGVYTTEEVEADSSITLPADMVTMETMTVKAIYIADALIDSINAGNMTYSGSEAAYYKSRISTFTFEFARAYSKPDVRSAYQETTEAAVTVKVGNKLADEVTVASGQQIVFAIPESNYDVTMLPLTGEKGQVVSGVNESTGAVIFASATDAEYVDSYVVTEGNYVTPVVKYRIASGEDDLAAEPEDKDDWINYTAATPKVVYLTRLTQESNVSTATNAEQQENFAFTITNAIQPRVLTVNGTGTIYYQVYIDGENSAFYSGEILNQKFVIRSPGAAPSAEPAGTQEEPGAVSVKEAISLVANNENTTIFYNLTNANVDYMARIEWDKRYFEWLNGGEDTAKKREGYAIRNNDPEPTTYKYSDVAIAVKKNRAMYLYVNAIEVSNGDFDDDLFMQGDVAPSATAKFRYTINKLENLSAIVATPETKADAPAELARGQEIILSNESNTYIYYTTDGSSPSIDDRIALDEAKAYLSEYSDQYENAGLSEYKQELLENYFVNGVDTLPTKIYDSSDKVIMDPSGDDAVMVINAIAAEKDGNKENSPMATFYYQLGKVSPVEATVVEIETNGEVTTLAPGATISLRSSTPGAEIYYTTDSTVPDPDSYGDASSTTIKYDAKSGIVMPKDISTFFTVRAVAVTPLNGDGYRSHADSDLATFIYQLPAPVQAVYATPVAGSVVKGTEVTLKTTTEGATIYFETGKASDLKANSSQTFEEGTPIVIDKNTTIYTMAVKNGVESKVTTFKYTVAATLPTPTPSIATGSMVGNGTGVKLTSQEGATIIYTTDGSDPKKADNANLKYGDTVLLSGSAGATVSVQAYATMTGYTSSEIMTATYTIATAEGYLTVSPASGATVANGTAVNMTTTLSGSTIHYTTDGTDPTAESPSGNSVTLSGEPGATINLKVSVFDASGNPGTTTLVTYTIQAKASAPSSTVESGAYFMDGAAIKLTAAEGLIYYTTDGSDPTASSSLYGDIAKLGSDITAYPDIKLRDSVVVKAIAVVEGKANSDIAQFTYTKAGQVIAPVFSESSGEIDQNEAIGLTTSTEGASIYYTTRGTDPDASDLSSLTLYTGPITVTRPVTIKAIAVKDQMHASVVNSATYTVKVPEPKEPDGAAGDVPAGTDTGRLASRRTYSDTDTGPKYTDVRISNAEFGMVVSSEKDTIPADCELVITEVTPGNPDKSSVSSVTDYSVARLYEIKLMRNGEEVQPEGEIEIGIPIDAEYQNATLEIIQINTNGTAQELDTRRAGGMAYVTTGSLNRVAITMPKEQIKKSNTWIWVAAVGGVGLLAGGTALGVMAYKNKHKDKNIKPGAGPKPGQQPRPQPPMQTPPQPPQGR